MRITYHINFTNYKKVWKFCNNIPLEEGRLTSVEDVAVAGARDDLPVVCAGQELGRKYVGAVNSLHVLNNSPGQRK